MRVACFVHSASPIQVTCLPSSLPMPCAAHCGACTSWLCCCPVAWSPPRCVWPALHTQRLQFRSPVCHHHCRCPAQRTVGRAPAGCAAAQWPGAHQGACGLLCTLSVSNSGHLSAIIIADALRSALWGMHQLAVLLPGGLEPIKVRVACFVHSASPLQVTCLPSSLLMPCAAHCGACNSWLCCCPVAWSPSRCVWPTCNGHHQACKPCALKLKVTIVWEVQVRGSSGSN